MTLKENILEVINARGSLTDTELSKWCKAPLPSVRRTRNELVKTGQLFLQPPSARGNTYGTKFATIGEAIGEMRKAKSEKKAPHFEVVPEKKPEKPAPFPKRMTDYTF